jgi:hypothetical protein
VIAGGWALARVVRGRAGRLGGAGYGAALVAVGAGSFAYHGPQFGGADALHNASIAAVGAFIAGDVVARRGELGALARRPATWVAGAALAAGAAVNVLTRTGAPGCRPDSLLQGHAAWHVLTAAALAAWASARTALLE